jgi:hypothetical protein
MNDAQAIRNELSRIHFRSSVHWIDDTGDLLGDKLFNDLKETLALFPWLVGYVPGETIDSGLRVLVQDIRDLVLVLRGEELIQPYFPQTPHMSKVEAEYFLDNYVPVKLNRLIERLFIIINA